MAGRKLHLATVPNIKASLHRLLGCRNEIRPRSATAEMQSMHRDSRHARLWNCGVQHAAKYLLSPGNAHRAIESLTPASAALTRQSSYSWTYGHCMPKPHLRILPPTQHFNAASVETLLLVSLRRPPLQLQWLLPLLLPVLQYPSCPCCCCCSYHCCCCCCCYYCSYCDC